MNHHECNELITEAEERAIKAILEAKLETDEDMIALVRLIDDIGAEYLPNTEIGIDNVSTTL